MAAAMRGREQAELRRVAGGLDGGGRWPHTLAPASPPPTPSSTASSVAVTATECGCLDDVNAYAVQFNAAAKNLLERLNTKLPGASILNPTSHTSCCDVDTTVGGLCLPTAQLCDDRTAFVFWDAYHTSDAANQVIADRLYADMVSAGAVQGNVRERLHPRASRRRQRRRAAAPPPKHSSTDNISIGRCAPAQRRRLFGTTTTSRSVVAWSGHGRPRRGIGVAAPPAAAASSVDEEERSGRKSINT
uniref:GDSL esterase/lipase n=1 Tax=Oryza glumipatula TaxID=40148 RepID=A0A0D9YQU7_9ORYZ